MLENIAGARLRGRRLYQSSNSMGFSCQLFADPVFILPVLYHEFLHYSGIDNEADVWSKENVYLEYLIKKYRENRKAINPIYENILTPELFNLYMNLVQSIKIFNINSLTDTILLINQFITGQYGLKVDEKTAGEEAVN